ncbi:hypothetical protein C8R43DRAFT_1119547 [Mycena crocata]|nr:hypothetical protein C8R43DRAFT_1119547 [Mycena crocata]
MSGPSSTFVRSVNIRHLIPPYFKGAESKEDLIRTLDLLRQTLTTGLASLQNLRSFRWQLDSEEDSIGIESSILDTLNILPHFSDLEIVLPGHGTKSKLPPSVPFERLRNLREIILCVPEETAEWTCIVERVLHPLSVVISHSPGLKSLTIDQTDLFYQYRDASKEPNTTVNTEHPCFHHLVAKLDALQPLHLECLQLHHNFFKYDQAHRAHFKYLDKLALELPSAGLMYEEDTPMEKYAPCARDAALWWDLTDERIFPSTFYTATPTDQHVLRYLGAHPGLQRLDLTEIELLYDPDDFDVYADIFFENVLPWHTTTPTHLAINPAGVDAGPSPRGILRQFFNRDPDMVKFDYVTSLSSFPV